VETVSWDECQEFCRKLRAREGADYRVPTEAEWEYACRAGTITPFYFGETIGTDQVNYNGLHPYGKGKKCEDSQQTSTVGSLPPNAWGLYDMHGNVWEWCADLYGESSASESDNVDPQGASSGSARVVRGGSWRSHARHCRSANCDRRGPKERSNNLGFRLVRGSVKNI
jgi:formylglycine-generating enzyme required for sulfatase activity